MLISKYPLIYSGVQKMPEVLDTYCVLKYLDLETDYFFLFLPSRFLVVNFLTQAGLTSADVLCGGFFWWLFVSWFLHLLVLSLRLYHLVSVIFATGAGEEIMCTLSYMLGFLFANDVNTGAVV